MHMTLKSDIVAKFQLIVVAFYLTLMQLSVLFSLLSGFLSLL